MEGGGRKRKIEESNIQLRTPIHGACYRPRQEVSSETIAIVRVLAPILPARLKQVSRRQERVIPEDGSDGVKVRGAIGRDKLVDFLREVGEFGDSRAQLICRQQPGRAVELRDGHLVKQGH